MAEYGFFVPAAGRSYIAGLMAGETLEISRIMVGSGKPATLEDMASLTDLVAPVAQGTSTEPLRKGDSVEMVVEYRSDLNGGLSTGFWLNEFGVFAMDGDDEVMIYYGCLGDFPQWVSAYNQGAIDIRRYPVVLQVAEAVDVVIAYPALAFMTAEDVEEFCMTVILPQFLTEAQELIDTHDADADAHPAIHTEMDGLDSRLTLLELMYSTDVSGNPFTITFQNLDSVTVEGVHNVAQARIEF